MRVNWCVIYFRKNLHKVCEQNHVGLTHAITETFMSCVHEHEHIIDKLQSGMLQ